MVRSCLGDPDCPARHFCGDGQRRRASARWSRWWPGRSTAAPATRTATVRCWGLAESIRAGGAVGAGAGADAPGGGGAGPVGRGAPDLRRDPGPPGALLGQPGPDVRRRPAARAGAAADRQVTGGGPGRGLRLRHQPAGHLVLGQATTIGQLAQPLTTSRRASWRCWPTPGGSASSATGIAGVGPRSAPAGCAPGAATPPRWSPPRTPTGLYTTPQCRPVGGGGRSWWWATPTPACCTRRGLHLLGRALLRGAGASAARTRPTSARRARRPRWRSPCAAMAAGVSHTCVLLDGRRGHLLRPQPPRPDRTIGHVHGGGGSKAADGGDRVLRRRWSRWAAVPAPTTPARSSRAVACSAGEPMRRGSWGTACGPLIETRKSRDARDGHSSDGNRRLTRQSYSQRVSVAAAVR